MSGIYIHIPFCKQACHYCDFHFSTSLKRKDELVQALIREIVLRKTELQGTTIETIYFGGGTPSLLAVDELQQLIDTVFAHFNVIDNPEITLEVNPDDLVDTRTMLPSIFEAYKSIGINRLSIGIQSFFEDDLKSMNRAHSSVEAKECLSKATRYFDNITIDLIYGIPNMSVDKWNENLEIAFGYGIRHISSYALTVEPKTALDVFIKKGSYPPIDESLALQHFNHLIKRTNEQGFIHYEISNFGKPNYFSKHNKSYWLGNAYLGVGPSAHSFNGTERSWNVSNNARYIKAIQQNLLPSEKEVLAVNDKFNEQIMTGLRTIWGVNLTNIEESFGVNYKNQLVDTAQKFIQQGLLNLTTNDLDEHQNNIEKLTTTNKGKFLADGIASELFMI